MKVPMSGKQLIARQGRDEVAGLGKHLRARKRAQRFEAARKREAEKIAAAKQPSLGDMLIAARPELAS